MNIEKYMIKPEVDEDEEHARLKQMRMSKIKKTLGGGDNPYYDNFNNRRKIDTNKIENNKAIADW